MPQPLHLALVTDIHNGRRSLTNQGPEAIRLLEQFAEFVESLASHSMDVNGWHLVFWQADVHMSLDHEPTLTDDDLAWLESDLAASDLPAVVFSHVPLDGASMRGNYYFQANPQFGGYSNVDRAQGSRWCAHRGDRRVSAGP